MMGKKENASGGGTTTEERGHAAGGGANSNNTNASPCGAASSGASFEKKGRCSSAAGGAGSAGCGTKKEEAITERPPPSCCSAGNACSSSSSGVSAHEETEKKGGGSCGGLDHHHDHHQAKTKESSGGAAGGCCGGAGGCSLSSSDEQPAHHHSENSNSNKDGGRGKAKEKDLSSCCTSGACGGKNSGCDDQKEGEGVGGCCEDQQGHGNAATKEDSSGGAGAGCSGGENEHGHRHHHHHHHTSEEAGSRATSNGNGTDGDGTSLCLAVVRENGTDVVLFDATGKPRTFRYQGPKQLAAASLCFRSHGGYDDWLTPCLDEDGRHIVTSNSSEQADNNNNNSTAESCFCGVETPHLHAHVRDPATCDGDDGDPRMASERNIGKLASQILHPNDEEEEENDSHEAVLHMPVTERMPKQCNFQQAARSASEASGGGSSSHHGCSDNCNNNSSSAPSHPGNRRLHKVQHDDHVDYLVHNGATGSLHLEHPGCADCGKNDIHGKFDAVGKRRLKKVQIHFFEVAPRPFNVLESLTDLFQMDTDARVNAVENIMKKPSSTTASERQQRQHHLEDSSGSSKRKAPGTGVRETKMKAKSAKNAVVRSTFKCTQICCAAEIPMINSVLEPVVGVEKIMINVTLKRVTVDHNVAQITASQIAKTLHSFGATVTRDGGEISGSGTLSTTTTGRSQFYVQNICCASEIPAILSIVEPVPGVHKVSINTTTKLVYVDHATDTVTAQQICDLLNADSFGALIRLDAATVRPRGSAFVQSQLSLVLMKNAPVDGDNNNNKDAVVDYTETLTTFLQTFVDASQVETFVVDLPGQRITVTHNPFCLSAPKIAALVSERTPLEATVTLDGADPAHWDYPQTLQTNALLEDADAAAMANSERGATYPRPTVVVSGLLWVVSMLSWIGGNWEHLKWVALVSVAFGIPPIAVKAFRTMRRYQFDTNCLMFFASVGAIALQDYTEAAAVVFLFALSEWLEVRATSRARQALAAIVNLRPEKANLVHPFTQEILSVPASSVPVGALVSVKTGDKIPCDGVVVEGISTVDESSLTGESRPIRKGPKDKVSGGTVNSGLSPIMVQTTSSSEDSAVSRLIRLVEEAQANRSDTEKIVDEFAKVYTPLVVLSAIFMCSIPWIFGRETGRQWTENGLILIVVACPCALIISTPVSYVAGLAAAAQKGILIKGGATLEALGSVKHICFDKTGTLTNGEFALLHLEVLTESLSRVAVFQYLALMEERASHPVAQAILAAANNEKVVLPKKMVLQKHTIINGEGVLGVIDGKEVYVGNERLFERLGLLSNVSEKDRRLVEEWKYLGGTIGYMSIEGHGIVCAYCAADGIREEAESVVKNLKKLGISINMLTGDNLDAALAIGKQVGLPPDDIKAKLLPEEKLQFVEGLSHGQSQGSIIRSICKRKHLVMHCGDGVNDAPALAAADVGVAMGEGAALSMETSDVTLLDSNLEKIEYSIRMGKKVTAKIIQNVIFSLTVKFVVLGFALAGMADLWAAIASDVGAMLLVTLNAMLLLPKRQKSTDVHIMKKGDVEEGKSRYSNVGLARENGSGCDTASVDDAERKHKKNSATTVCSKGCCTSLSSGGAAKTSADTVAVATKASPKGCCSGGKKTVAEPGAPNHEIGTPLKTKACSKTCCGSSKDTKKDECGGKDKHNDTSRDGCCGSSNEETKKGACGGKDNHDGSLHDTTTGGNQSCCSSHVTDSSAGKKSQDCSEALHSHEHQHQHQHQHHHH